MLMCYICARTSHWNSDYLGRVYSRIDCLNFSASGNEIIRELEGQIRVGNNIDGQFMFCSWEALRDLALAITPSTVMITALVTLFFN